MRVIERLKLVTQKSESLIKKGIPRIYNALWAAKKITNSVHYAILDLLIRLPSLNARLSRRVSTF